MIIYTDMVADLFHYGHYNYIKQINDTYKKEGDLLYIGIHNDIDPQIYKRKPILTMEERIKVLECCKYVDKIIPNAPVVVDMDYIKKNNIDILVMPDNRTEEEIKLMYKEPNRLNMIRKVPYTHSISTSDIIKRIKNRIDL